MWVNFDDSCDGTAQTFGYDLSCYDNDNGDCDGSCCSSAACADGAVYDCQLQCVSSSLASSYNGDGWCDGWTYGLYLDCAEFNNDSGDCDVATGGTDVLMVNVVLAW